MQSLSGTREVQLLREDNEAAKVSKLQIGTSFYLHPTHMGFYSRGVFN